jgi:hypothetical protein
MVGVVSPGDAIYDDGRIAFAVDNRYRKVVDC